ncbi:hypothetical protein HYT55_00295 [Candidatus Woesearchaeota archaeon]|nr:hypothetical protein [Candidatus Woesearchaeota archaeon]
MSHAVSLDEVVFSVEEKTGAVTTKGKIGLKTRAEGNGPLYAVGVTVEIEAVTTEAFLRYDAAKRIFIDAPSDLQSNGWSARAIRGVMEKLSSAYARLVSEGYVTLKEVKR